ncbi:MAG: hypothetical protein ACK4UT_00975 [Moraxellaceae bacterium]
MRLVQVIEVLLHDAFGVVVDELAHGGLAGVKGTPVAVTGSGSDCNAALASYVHFVPGVALLKTLPGLLARP